MLEVIGACGPPGPPGLEATAGGGWPGVRWLRRGRVERGG